MDGKCRFCGTRKSRHAEAACGSRHVSDLRHDNERLVRQAADMATELAAAQRDAGRYRWLRNTTSWTLEFYNEFFSMEPERLDAAIDAALAAKGE